MPDYVGVQFTRYDELDRLTVDLDDSFIECDFLGILTVTRFEIRIRNSIVDS